MSGSNLKSEGDEPLSTLCLPAIPFQKIRPEDIPKTFSSTFDRELGYVVGCIRSRKFTDQLGRIGEFPEADLARAFAPHTSGVLLEQIAKTNPEIAGLFACHPNGGDISIQDVPNAQRSVVEFARNHMGLSARQRGAVPQATQRLVL